MAQLFPSIEEIKRMRPQPTDGEWTLLRFLVDNYDDQYEVYFQPFLNGDMPDIVLMRRGGGVMIFEVKDWDLNNYKIDAQGRWRVMANNATNYENPFNQVMRYKENLYNIHVDELASLKLKDYKYWYVVNCAVYFHCHSEEKAKARTRGTEPTEAYKKWLEKNITILGKDSLSKANIDTIFDKLWISRRSYYFTDSLYSNFKRIFHPSVHTLEMGEEIHLSNIQSELAMSVAGQRKRIKGVAGSGKTLVLAHRAVDAVKRTGENVLILTFNITLRNYIHDKISQVREEFPWSNFKIVNYHDFINAQLNNLCLKPFKETLVGLEGKEKEDEFEKVVYSNLDLFEGFEDRLPRFSTILIDEAQDFKEGWFRMIMKYFATDETEIVAFADEKQNVYSRRLDSQKQLVVPVATGRWDERMCKSFRIPAKLTMLLERFQKEFFSERYNIDTIQGRQMEIGEETEIHYLSYAPPLGTKEERTRDVVSFVYDQIRSKGLNSNDVTILASYIDTLKELNELLKAESHEKTNLMFESKEEEKQIIEEASKKNGANIKMEIEKFRKMRKATFWMNRGTYKLSTVFSFKGWETPVLFYIIETGNNSGMYRTYDEDAEEGFVPVKFSDELVYTGLSRCKGKLYIINIDYDEHPGNNRYDAFFTSLPSSIISCEVHQQGNDTSEPPTKSLDDLEPPMDSFDDMMDGWIVKERRPFNQTEIDAVRLAVVVTSEYGNSVCFFMKSGGRTYLPLSINSTKGIGESIDLRKANVLTLSKRNEADITRVECKD